VIVISGHGDGMNPFLSLFTNDLRVSKPTEGSCIGVHLTVSVADEKMTIVKYSVDVIQK
jgi:hypothetical protein